MSTTLGVRITIDDHGRATEITLVADLSEDAPLAFANTLSWRGREARVEALRDFGDLVHWAAASAGLATGIVCDL